MTRGNTWKSLDIMYTNFHGFPMHHLTVISKMVSMVIHALGNPWKPVDSVYTGFHGFTSAPFDGDFQDLETLGNPWKPLDIALEIGGSVSRE